MQTGTSLVLDLIPYVSYPHRATCWGYTVPGLGNLVEAPQAGFWGAAAVQAFLITGDANATDPVCSLAPAHRLVEEWVARTNSAASTAAGSTPTPHSEQPWTYRPQPG